MVSSIPRGSTINCKLTYRPRIGRLGSYGAVLSNEQDQLRQVAEQLTERYRTENVACVRDLRERSFLETIEKAIADRHVAILVNNAAFGSLGQFHDLALNTYLDMIDVNCRPYLALTYKFLKKMKERSRGALIFVSSVNAFSPVGFSAVYTATKAFDLYFANALWQELRTEGSGIDVLTICPSATRTNFQRRAGTRVAAWAWEPGAVVEVGLQGLGRKSTVVVSWRGKVFYYITKHLPRHLGIRFATWAINSNLRNR